MTLKKKDTENTLSYLRSLSKYMPDKQLKIFFSGIAGSGMSAIACFMSDRGHKVVGSDRGFDSNPRASSLHHIKV